jgi:puromycin-sensitive aminopeptidase
MERNRNIKQFKGQTRLPKFAIPDRYDLHLKPDLSVCTFSGTICINLRIIEPTKLVVLNVLELNIHGVLFTDSQNQVNNPCLIVVSDDVHSSD